jgi:hypothetical protein
MAANTAPIYSTKGIIGFSDAVVAAANTTKDLTSGTIYLCHTAAADGDFVERIRFRALGTNIATVGRVWINNGATTGTATNNRLIDEITLSATTVSEVASQVAYELPLGFILPNGYRIYVTVGTVVAAGYHVTVFGGTYTA